MNNDDFIRKVKMGFGDEDDFESYSNQHYTADTADDPDELNQANGTGTVSLVDSINIKPVEDLDALTVAGGERYDIVIQTKLTFSGLPYKINVYNNHSGVELCTLAWLKYPGQVINTNEVPDCDAMEEKLATLTKLLNPVPNDLSEWKKRGTKYIYPSDLKSLYQASLIGNQIALLNSHSVSMDCNPAKIGSNIGCVFNNFSMAFPRNYAKNNQLSGYPEVPYLYQSPNINTDRCGVNCKKKDTLLDPFLKTDCTTYTETCPKDEPCFCQHVLQQPWFDLRNKFFPSLQKAKYWFEIILITNPMGRMSHPIHQHGGWYNIIGQGQFDPKEYNITRESLEEKDREGEGLPRNYDHPVFKDVVQVPTNGYVIFRAPVDNQGTWIVHCHINFHVEHGMAMIFEIQDFNKKPPGFTRGPTKEADEKNKNKNCF